MGYASQTAELKDINRKVEESVVRVKLNQEQILQQDEQLSRVGTKLTHIQAKAETAGQLVNGMRAKENKSTIVLKWGFLGLLVSNIIMGVYLVITQIQKVLHRTTFGAISRSFLPHLFPIQDVTDERKLYVDYYYDWR